MHAGDTFFFVSFGYDVSNRRQFTIMTSYVLIAFKKSFGLVVSFTILDTKKFTKTYYNNLGHINLISVNLFTY